MRGGGVRSVEVVGWIGRSYSEGWASVGLSRIGFWSDDGHAMWSKGWW